MGLGLKIVQIAYGVDDIEVGAAEFQERFGIGPFKFAHHNPVTSPVHAGDPATFDHSSAFAQWGELMIELIHVHSASPESLANKVRTDRPGIHHVSSFAPDFDAEIERQVSYGHDKILEGRGRSGSRFVFLDATKSLGHIIELYEPTEKLYSFYALIKERDGKTD